MRHRNCGLLEPVTRILVNLGYGDIEHGWSQGPADVATPLGFLPDSATLTALMQQLPQALSNGQPALGGRCIIWCR